MPDQPTDEANRRLRGLEKIARIYGSMKCGDVVMVWDYVNECAVPEREMPHGSKRRAESERARWQLIREAQNDQDQLSRDPKGIQ